MLKQQLQSSIINHARTTYPKECCGLIIGDAYYPCNNIAVGNDMFEIDPNDLIKLSELGEIQAIVHSHPNGTPEPSMADKIAMAYHGVDWVICAVTPIDSSIAIYTPAPFSAPLVGREYAHGVLDCYSLIQDYFWRECNIELSGYPRLDAWWEDPNSPSLYLENFKKEGFYPVDNLQKHDVILCQVGRTHHVNHALVYLGDGALISEQNPCIGQDIILHHPYGKLSVREVYGQEWRKRTALIVRHKKFIRSTDENN